MRKTLFLIILTFCRLSGRLALSRASFAAAAQVVEPLITEAMTARPATRSAQAQPASAWAGLPTARWRYWRTSVDIRTDSRPTLKYPAKPVFKAFGGALNGR